MKFRSIGLVLLFLMAIPFTSALGDGTPPTTAMEDSLTTAPAGYTTDGKTLYWIDSRGRTTAALIAQDVATGNTRVIGENAKADIGGALSNPKTGEVEAYSVTYLREEWVAIDPKIVTTLGFHRRCAPGQSARHTPTAKGHMIVQAGLARRHDPAGERTDSDCPRQCLLLGQPGWTAGHDHHPTG